MSSDAVKDFWEQQAESFGQSDLATAPDHHYRQLEIREILKHLGDGQRVLDVGCGNGYSTLRFSSAFPSSEFIGVDYSPTMVEHARAAAQNARLEARARFIQADVLDLDALEHSGFDVVVSERCIINLRNWEEQKNAILNMRRKLKPGGKLVLVENTQEGLASLNSLRAEFGLHEIKTRWHNFYVPQKELEEWLPEFFQIDLVENIGNLYYIMSRVLYASLAKRSGEEPDYNHPINEIASHMPTLGNYSFSPNFLYSLTATGSDVPPG